LNIITINFGTELKLIQNSCKSQLYKVVLFNHKININCPKSRLKKK